MRKPQIVIVSDAAVENHGSIFLLRPLTSSAKDWISENLPNDVMWFDGAVAIEPRYVCDIIDGMLADGLCFQGLAPNSAPSSE